MAEGAMSLSARVITAVDRLTLTTKQMTKVGERTVFYDAEPLLSVLRQEVTPSGESGSGSSESVGSGAPAALGVLDLLVEVEGEINRAYWLMRDATRRPGFGGYTLEERLRYTAAKALDAGRPELLADAPAWVERIERLFDPPKVVPLIGHACPMCRQEKATVQVEPGEFVQAPALSVVLGDKVAARCAECGSSWPADQLVDLAMALGGDTQALVHLFELRGAGRVA
ncbi:MAG: hypothetical protein QJR09_11955 [Micrococcus sp.]|nr:hypothetical protein [Micrococcus sp.]